MSDSEKPFACSLPGCFMSFTNEDHLVVHKKKHDMVLNLGNSGKNTFVADQTPTPTRFIRNCEEVGLFQDLQNVNPFEETFRRAVEDGKTGALSDSEAGETDDTLHTPHIFPNISEASVVVVDLAVSKDSKETNPEESGDDKNHSDESIEPVETKRPAIIVKSIKSVETSGNGIIVHEADTSAPSKITENTKTSPNLSINGQEVQLILKTADGKLMQLSAVPLCENRNQSCRVEGVKNSLHQADDSIGEEKKISPNGNNNRLTLAKMRLKQTLTKNGTTCDNPVTAKNSPENAEKPKSNKNSEKNLANTEQRRKQDVLARNRASSMRARAKRKMWIQQLQRTASNVNEKNSALQLEVKALKCEVAKLRALLLAHDNCPVTKAMEKGTVIGMESKNSSIIQTVVENIQSSQTSVSSRRKTRKFGETPIAPKIMKLSHHPILPKSETIKQHDFVVKNLSTIKIVDVQTIPRSDNNEVTKKILFVENPTRKLQLVRTTMTTTSSSSPSSSSSVTTRQTIQMKPTSLKIENAASKCTGT